MAGQCINSNPDIAGIGVSIRALTVPVAVGSTRSKWLTSFPDPHQLLHDDTRYCLDARE